MLARHGSRAIKQTLRTQQSDLQAVVAQIPSFLLPSFHPTAVNTLDPRPTVPSRNTHSRPSTSTSQKVSSTSLEQPPSHPSTQTLPSSTSTAPSTAEKPPNKEERLKRLRAQCMEIAQRPDPSTATRQDILEARRQIKQLDRLDDSGPIKKLCSTAIKRGFDDIVVRLINETTNLMLLRRNKNGQVNKMKVTSWVYVDSCQLLARLDRWTSVVELTNQALNKGLWNGALLLLRMRALNRRGRYVEAIETFGLYQEKGIEVDGRAYDEVIEAHLLNGELGTAQRILQTKGDRGFPTTVETCLSLFDGMALYGGNKVMEEKVLHDCDEDQLERRKAIRQEIKVLNKIMSVRAGREATREALALLDFYNLERYPQELVERIRNLAHPSLSSPSSSSSFSPNLPHDLDRFWKPPPDRASLVTLVGLALRHRRTDIATDILSTTHARSFDINDHLVAAIVRTLLTEGQINSAEEFVFALPAGQASFNSFHYPSFQPGTFVYESLLSGVLRFRGLAGMNECFRKLMETRQPPLKVTQGLTRALVDYLALEKMETLGVSADLLIKVRNITRGETKPTRRNLDTLLKAAWQSERLSINEWTRMRRSIEKEFPIPQPEEGREPPLKRPLPVIGSLLMDDKSKNNMITLPSSSGRPPSKTSRTREFLYRVHQSLTSRNVRHSAETAAHVLRNDHLIRFITAKWDYLQAQVLDLGIRPTYQHFAILIRAYLLLADVKGATLALRYALDEVKIEPHVALYSTMINGLSRMGRKDVALSMYEEMRYKGLEPDRQLFAALAMSFSRMRDLRGLERVFQQIREVVEFGTSNDSTKNVDPALLAQAQLQTRVHLERSQSSSDFTTTPSLHPSTLSYDPLLDPVFLTIYYRTLNMIERHLDAQRAISDALDRGLVPDLIVKKVLERTGSWSRWKGNRLQWETAKDRRDRHEMLEIWQSNIDRVRSLLLRRRGSASDQLYQLETVQRYWEKAERGKADEQEWRKFFDEVAAQARSKEDQS